MVKQPKAFLGSVAADAVAMPVHWYYDRAALERDYGTITGYLAPKSPHPDSILWRSAYTPVNPKGEILHDQAIYWGQRGIHYHQFLHAGENTLNFQLSRVLYDQTLRLGHYAADAWLDTYIDFMLTPGRHSDTYVEEYHRHFFTNYARGKKPRACGCQDVHIGGLAMVPALFDALDLDPKKLREVVQEHVALTHQDKDVLRAADAFVRILIAVRAGKSLRQCYYWKKRQIGFRTPKFPAGSKRRTKWSSVNILALPAIFPMRSRLHFISHGNMPMISAQLYAPTLRSAEIPAIAARLSGRYWARRMRFRADGSRELGRFERSAVGAVSSANLSLAGNEVFTATYAYRAQKTGPN